MKKEILDLLSWTDVREVQQEVQAELSGYIGPSYVPPEEEFYNLVIHRLRERNGAKDPCLDRYLVVARKAEEATGTRLTPRREQDVVLTRSFVAYRLRKEGYGPMEIGRAMGRNHATVLHLCRRLEDMLAMPRCYGREFDLYCKFEDSLDPL